MERWLRAGPEIPPVFTKSVKHFNELRIPTSQFLRPVAGAQKFRRCHESMMRAECVDEPSAHRELPISDISAFALAMGDRAMAPLTADGEFLGTIPPRNSIPAGSASAPHPTPARIFTVSAKGCSPTGGFRSFRSFRSFRTRSGDTGYERDEGAHRKYGGSASTASARSVCRCFSRPSLSIGAAFNSGFWTARAATGAVTAGTVGRCRSHPLRACTKFKHWRAPLVARAAKHPKVPATRLLDLSRPEPVSAEA
jgi:hypothetical protein